MRVKKEETVWGTTEDFNCVMRCIVLLQSKVGEGLTRALTCRTRNNSSRS